MHQSANNKKVPCTSGPSFRRKISGLEFLLFLCISDAVLFSAAERIPMFQDEAPHIWMSGILEIMLAGNSEDPIWKDDRLMLDHPPGVGYIAGAGRLFGRYIAGDTGLPTFWPGENENRPTIKWSHPSPNLLFWARSGPIFLAGFLLSILCMALKALSGRAAAWTGLLLFLSSQTLVELLCYAKGESGMLFFLALSASLFFAATWRERALKNPRLVSIFFFLAGLMLGASASSKLTALVIAPALVIGSFLLPLTMRYRPLCSLFYMIATTAGIASGFVAPNPYLYSDPIAGTKNYLSFRAAQLDSARRGAPKWAITSMKQRVEAFSSNLFSRWGVVRLKHASILNAALSLTGLVLLVFISSKHGRRSCCARTCLLYLSFALIPAFLTPVNWPRYYFLPLVVVLFLTAMALGHLLQATRRILPVPSDCRLKISSTGNHSQ